MTQEVKESTTRATWSGKWAFILAAAASAVGLGNLWRFPYLAAKYGGGMFLLTYLVLVLTFGVSLLLLETALGRKTRLSVIGAFRHFGAKFTFIGVLAAAVDIDIIAAASPTDEGVVRLKSEGYPEDVTDIRRPDAKACRRGTSSALIAGVCAAFEAAGRKTGGFCAYTMSDVLTGSGLSSSAAFEVMLGNILSHFYNEGRVPAVELAKSGKYAENEFFGKPCGLMDQAACAVGGFAYMDFASAAEPEIEKLSLELGGRMLCIVNTGGNHADLTDDYASIPAEMKAVAAVFGKNCLREVDEAAFYASLPALRETCGDRAVLRAIHFFAENERVYAQLSLARAGIGRLVVQVLTEYLYG